LITVLITLAISTLLSVGAVALVLKISHKNGWYDHIDQRKIHTGNIPRLGGIGFSVTFLILMSCIGIIYWIDGVNIIRYLPCAAAIVIAISSGVYDDFRPMMPRYKLLLQIIAAICVIAAGYNFNRIVYTGGGLLTSLGFLAYPITILWIIGLTNAINFIDGVDGLAGGVSALIAFFLGLIIFSSDGVSKAVLFCICLFGVIAGFLIFNAPFPKAKIFMGDSGSQFLGITLALIPLMKGAETSSSMPVLYAAALFIIPIFDTTSAVWRRLRDGKKIYDPDRFHLHHKLMNMGFNSRGIFFLICSLQIIIGILIFIAINLEGLPSLLVLGFVYLLALIFFVVIHYKNRAIILKNKLMDDAASASP